MGLRDKIMAEEIKQSRRAILDALNDIYPGSFACKSICNVFVTVDKALIRRDLEYLLDKKYIKWTNPENNASWPGRKFKLTPSGKDIADKILIDPSLSP